MSVLKRLAGAAVIAALFTSSAIADTSFIVRRIEVRGAIGLSSKTVISYLPIRVGQRFSDASSPAIIQALYSTGFFNNIQVGQSGQTLIITVDERPTIGMIQITGNKEITTKKLKPVMKKIGIDIGSVYDPLKVQELAQGLEQQYDKIGIYNAHVTTSIVSEPRNRVQLNIQVDEGSIAKVRRITIIGNNAFSRRTLLSQFKTTTGGLITFITHTNRYSKDRLDQDLQNLIFFYMDHGYFRARITSQDVQFSADHRYADITITVDEGPIYHFSGYRIEGQYDYQDDVAHVIAAIRTGAVFSRQLILHINDEVTHYFADHGYAFPQIEAIPQIDDVNHTIFLTYQISMGHRVYVHEIYFTGNDRTQDRVLRSQTQQMEASLYNLKSIDETKRRIANLPYLQNITVNTVPVPGHADQVDLNYHVHEVNAGKISVQGGWSDVDGWMYGASISEPNFMGTGKYVSIGFTRSQFSSSYSFSYNNPFYTIDGISRGFNVYYTHVNANTDLNMDPYSMDDYGANVNYGIPMSDFDTLGLGYGYDRISIYNISGITSAYPAAPGTLKFLLDYTSPFNQGNVTVSWTHSSLDQAVFPTHGQITIGSVTTGIPFSNSFVGYYKATLSSKIYFPIGLTGFVIEPHTDLGYGGGYGNSSVYPFYNNFYAGGIETLPGFQPNSLGPFNPNNFNGATGGNVELLAGIHFIFPNPISDSVRTAIFLDAGNIFQTDQISYGQVANGAIIPLTLQPMTYENILLSNIRVASGLIVSWYSPLGIISFDVGYPIVKKRTDQPQIFGFTFGTNI